MTILLNTFSDVAISRRHDVTVLPATVFRNRFSMSMQKGWDSEVGAKIYKMQNLDDLLG